jgi:hypothetical protein
MGIVVGPDPLMRVRLDMLTRPWDCGSIASRLSMGLGSQGVRELKCQKTVQVSNCCIRL